MAPLEVLQALIAEGVAFSTDGNTVRWRDPEGWMKPDAVAVLRAGKPAVIAYLTRQDRDDLFQERAAILEYDAGMSRPDAEAAARAIVYGGAAPNVTHERKTA